MHLADHDRIGPPVARVVRHFAEPGEKLVVWGWMDRFYLLTGMRPGTLHCNSLLEILGPHQDYFLSLYLRQFDQARAPVFIDAVGPNSFIFTDKARYGHENFPELRRRIAADYEQVGELSGVRVYVRKERLGRLGRR
jgi:hypothetical protein